MSYMTEAQDKYQEPIQEAPSAMRKPTEKSTEKVSETIEQKPVPPETSESPEAPKEKIPAPEAPEAPEMPKGKIPAPTSVSEEAPDSGQSQQQAQPAASDSDPQKQAKIKELCQLAFEKGLDTAIEQAKKLNNPYILDEFHDALVGELYKQLIEQGKLEQK